MHGYGHILSYADKNRIVHNIDCTDLRDEGVLRWPSKRIAVITGIIIIFFNFFYSNELINGYYVSCSSIRVALLELKELVHDMISASTLYHAFKDECQS